jgi:hypothetical protein
MEGAGRRIPAWKRLGLKLKSGQSAGTTQENQVNVAEHHHGEARVSAAINSNSDHNAPDRVDESTQSLGKRKHPAEDGIQKVRKSRKTEEQHESHGRTGQIAPTITSLDNGAAAPLPSTTASDKPRPKGDPNYRQKKGRKSDQYDSRKPTPRLPPETSGAQRPQQPRTPSLSPGQLDLASDGATLLVSTETDFPASAAVATQKNTRTLAKGDTKSASSSMAPRIDRRKSVTFTPDTKTVDGNSASNLFKKWAQEQKGAGAEFSQTEVAQFAPPPKSHPANGLPAASPPSAKSEKKERKSEKKVKKSASVLQPRTSDHSKEILLVEAHQEPIPDNEEATIPAASKGKKKDISRYTDYLAQYHNDRPNWKFNKARQNDILENALNIFRIPDSHSEALIAYVKGLQGAGVIQRLKQRCAIAIEELDAEMSTMDDAEVRKAAEEEALHERLSRERKRRRLEGDIENMLDHPYSEGYIRRLKKGRAQALLTALSLAAPAPAPASALAPAPAPAPEIPKYRTMKGLSKKFSPEPERPSAPIRQPRKKKRRTEVSSNESSDSSSSEDSGESDSESGSASSASSEAGDSTSDESSSGDEAPGSASDGSSSSDSGSDSRSGPEDASSDSDSDST